MEENIILETYHDNNIKNIHTRIEYLKNNINQNSIKNGIYEVYDKNGKLYLKTQYKNNEKNGEYIIFYKDSQQIKLKTYFKNNKVNGTKISYYPNGKIEEYCYFFEDLPHGQYKKFNEKGEIIENSLWLDGKRLSYKSKIRNEFIEKVYPELFQVTWHPSRVMNWCFAIDDFDM